MKALEDEEKEKKEILENKEFAPEEIYSSPINNYQYQPQQVPQYQPQQVPQYQPQQAPQYQKTHQFLPNKYAPTQTPPSQIQQRQHTYKPQIPAYTVPSKSFQRLERKYSVDSDAGSDSLKNTYLNEDVIGKGRIYNKNNNSN